MPKMVQCALTTYVVQYTKLKWSNCDTEIYNSKIRKPKSLNSTFHFKFRHKNVKFDHFEVCFT